MDETSGPPRRRREGSHLRTAVIVLALMALGQIVGPRLGRLPPVAGIVRWARLALSGSADVAGPPPDAMAASDLMLLLSLASILVAVVLRRDAVARFFRSPRVGAVLISLTIVAVTIGVLIPQIENFEDPQKRVTPENAETEYAAFRWAEGYFLYHLLHPYGIGMPEPQIPPDAEAGLQRFGDVYGKDEQGNAEKLMRQAFTGMAKTREIGHFIDRHDALLRGAFGIATFLELNRAYKSNWFATLMTLLGASVLLNLTRLPVRSWFRLRKAGFTLTHLGILILLLGGLAGRLLTERGLLQLRLGEPPQDTYYRHYTFNEGRLPFAVKLDHFARKEWKALEVLFHTVELGSTPPRYTLWEGREIELDHAPDGSGPRLRLRVAELHEHAEVTTTIVEDAGGDAWPVAELELSVAGLDAEGLGVTGYDVPGYDDEAHDDAWHDDAWLAIPEHAGLSPPAGGHAGAGAHAEAAGAESGRVLLSPAPWGTPHFDPHGAWRLAVAYGGDPASAFPGPDEQGVLGTLDVQVLGADDATPVAVPVRLGDRVPLPRGYEVQFVDAAADFRLGVSDEVSSNDDRPLAAQPYRFASVWIDLFGPDGEAPERRHLLELMDPVEYDLQDDFEHSDVVARLRWDPWRAPGPPRFVLAYGSNRAPMLLSEDGQTWPAEIGRGLALPGPTEVVPTRLAHRARLERGIDLATPPPNPDGWDPTFYDDAPRGLVLDVIRQPDTAAETTERIVLASTPANQADVWHATDGRFSIRFFENTQGFPQDWRSVLSIVERDADGTPYTADAGSEKAREIRVNDYLAYRGWHFFQTNADPLDPAYSGVGVVFDPGIPIVLVGMYTIIAGIAVAFLVRPLVERRRRRAPA